MNVEANKAFHGGQVRKRCTTSQILAENRFFAGCGHSTLLTVTFGIRQSPESVSVHYTVMILLGVIVVSSLVFHLILFSINPFLYPFFGPIVLLQ
jgi:hypothetical protein